MRLITCGLLFSAVFLTCVIGSFRSVHAFPAPAPFWSGSFGGASFEDGRAIAVDGSGNVLITGNFSGTINLGGGPLVSAGGADIFVAKYNASGVHQWSQRYGSTANDGGTSIAVDFAANVLVTGFFQGTVSFGGGNLMSAGSTDIFVAKYNASGVHQWSQRYGGVTTDEGYGIALEGANVVVTGSFTGTVNFGGGNLMSAGSADVFVAKYNSGGFFLWGQRFGGTSFEVGNALAVDSSGNVLVTGQFGGTVNFGGGNLVSVGDFDIFVAKYNSAGAHQWSQRFGNTLEDVGHSVATDTAGNVLVTGLFSGTVNFGGGNLVGAGFGYEIFVAKYNSAGVHQWSQRFGSTSDEVGYDVAVDGSDNVLLTGYFYGTVDFGGGNLVGSPGSQTTFLAKYDPAGVHQWSQRFVTTGVASGGVGFSVAAHGPGNVLLTGFFVDTVSFGGGTLVGQGNSDIFVAKFGPRPAEGDIIDIVDVPADQGRNVKIRFVASGVDDESAGEPVVRYEAFRRSDAAPAIIGQAAAIPGWMFVASVPAHAETEYEIQAPTLADSTATMGLYNSTFFIRAATAAPAVYFDSPPDSGYSLDNLSPTAPELLVFSAGMLSWEEAGSPDFDYFNVYGSDTSEFLQFERTNSLAASTLIGSTVEPSMDVTSTPYVYYFVTAVDFSGNEGKAAVINTLSGVGGTPRSYVLSVSAYPNPFNPETTIRYTVPARGKVEVSIFDLRGAHVATLVDEDRDAGAYTKSWNGSDGAGRSVSSGVYFARVTHASGTKSYKMVLLK